MKNRNRARRVSPLVIGTFSILILSALFTWWERSGPTWQPRTFVQAWLLTASGPFAAIETIGEATAWGWLVLFFWGTVNLLAVLSYSVWPSTYTKIVMVVGFIVWQGYGIMIPRMGI
jgi:hypothetical protein